MKCGSGDLNTDPEHVIGPLVSPGLFCSSKEAPPTKIPGKQAAGTKRREGGGVGVVLHDARQENKQAALLALA